MDPSAFSTLFAISKNFESFAMGRIRTNVVVVSKGTWSSVADTKKVSDTGWCDMKSPFMSQFAGSFAPFLAQFLLKKARTDGYLGLVVDLWADRRTCSCKYIVSIEKVSTQLICQFGVPVFEKVGQDSLIGTSCEICRMNFCLTILVANELSRLVLSTWAASSSTISPSSTSLS